MRNHKSSSNCWISALDISLGYLHTAENTYSSSKGIVSRHAMLYHRITGLRVRLSPHACLGRGPGGCSLLWDS